MLRSWALLHFVVLVWGLTAVIGKLIDLPSSTLVAWRTGIAVVALAVIARWRRTTQPEPAWRLRLMVTGLLIGFHWFLFFLAAQTGGPSACLIGVSTLSLWTALLDPIINRGHRWRWTDGLLSLVVMAGVALAVSGENSKETVHGVLIGVAAGLVAAVFGLINTRFVQRFEPMVMSLYQMAGAFLFTAACAVATSFGDSPHRYMPAGMEWMWLLVLALGCTVFAYSAYVSLLRKVSAFAIALAGNLEPVYGMLLAILFLGSGEIRGAQFYSGAAVILACVAVHQGMTVRQAMKKAPNTRRQAPI